MTEKVCEEEALSVGSSLFSVGRIFYGLQLFYMRAEGPTSVK